MRRIYQIVRLQIPPLFSIEVNVLGLLSHDPRTPQCSDDVPQSSSTNVKMTPLDEYQWSNTILRVQILVANAGVERLRVIPIRLDQWIHQTFNIDVLFNAILKAMGGGSADRVDIVYVEFPKAKDGSKVLSAIKRSDPGTFHTFLEDLKIASIWQESENPRCNINMEPVLTRC